MTNSKPADTKLLVSVRSVAEARIALESGADIIDLKEPDGGSLGSVTAEVADDISTFVDGRIPLSLAMGELASEYQNGRMDQFFVGNDAREILNRFDFAKVGMSMTAEPHDWRSSWLKWSDQMPPRTQPVLACYVDEAANCPELGQMLDFAIRENISTVLLDTWSKNGHHLFDWVNESELRPFLQRAARNQIVVALAGSLSPETIPRAAVINPPIVAVRTAACENGRSSNLCASRIRQLKRILDSASPNHPTVAT